MCNIIVLAILVIVLLPMLFGHASSFPLVIIGLVIVFALFGKK